MITSLANERVKAARRLQNRRYRRKARKLLIEGVRLIRDALQSGFVPERAFFSPELTARNREAERLIGELRDAQVTCLSLSPQVFASLVTTVTPQGIAAVVSMPALPVPKRPTLSLVLDRIGDPGNAGTLLRSADAAGVDLVVFGPGTVDAYNNKTVRAGMGAHFRLPIQICADWRQVWSVIGSPERIYVAEAEAELTYDDVDWTEPAALVIGSESRGPSDVVRSRGVGVSIPMHGAVESLNAAMAGAVILFEAARQRRRAKDAAPAVETAHS